MEDAVTLNTRHFIQMWQHLKRALEEFAQIKLKSVFMHLKIRRPSLRSTSVPGVVLPRLNKMTRVQCNGIFH